MTALRALPDPTETDFAPPEAPLDMPLQLLERARGAGVLGRLTQLLAGLRPGRAD